MTFQIGENVQINTTRPSGWNRKAWEPYGGMPAVVVQCVERTKGNREYLVLMQDGPLKGEHRWFKERELMPSASKELLNIGSSESES